MTSTGTIRQTKSLAGFEILHEIGQGGMGVVYLARQPALDRLVVLKKIRREIMADAGMVERFRLEARSAAAVHHQNVVAVYDSFPARGVHYIAQEYVEGADLGAVLDKITKIEPGVAARIALEIARGLEEVHARGIVHRDLKPSNVLLGSGGETKIADFGIAVEGRGSGLTLPGTLVGSVPYMSPEQMLGQRVDARSDLFSFGVLLYKMLTGKTPFCETDQEPLEDVLERIRAARYVTLHQHGVRVPRYLRRLIRNCLLEKPSRRVRSTTSVRQILEKRIGAISPADCRSEIAAFLWKHGLVRASGDKTTVRPMRATPKKFPRFARRYWKSVAGAAVILVVATLGLRFGLGTSPEKPLNVAESRVGMAFPAPLVSALSAEPARVRIVAYPWAEVHLEDGRSFETPRAAAIKTEPGEQVIVFMHPTLGRAEVMLDLKPGEERIVRHTFLAQMNR